MFRILNILLLTIGVAYSQSSDQLFSEANKHYNNNQFDDYIFENLQELKFKIKDIIKSQKLRSSQFQIDYLNEFMNFNKIMTKQYNLLIKEI